MLKVECLETSYRPAIAPVHIAIKENSLQTKRNAVIKAEGLQTKFYIHIVVLLEKLSVVNHLLNPNLLILSIWISVRRFLIVAVRSHTIFANIQSELPAFRKAKKMLRSNQKVLFPILLPFVIVLLAKLPAHRLLLFCGH